MEKNLNKKVAAIPPGNVQVIKPEISLIVAVTKNMIIGVNGDLPWKLLKDDMLHFKNTTTNHICIMGFNTWASFGKRPLPNRINIVISSKDVTDPTLTDYSKGYDLSNTHFVKSIDDAIFVCNKSQNKFGTINGVEYKRDVFVIGGGMTYEHFINLGLVDKMIITLVDVEVDVTHEDNYTYFPEFSHNDWLETEVSKQEINDRNEFAFEILEFTPNKFVDELEADLQ